MLHMKYVDSLVKWFQSSPTSLSQAVYFYLDDIVQHWFVLKYETLGLANLCSCIKKSYACFLLKQNVKAIQSKRMNMLQQKQSRKGKPICWVWRCQILGCYILVIFHAFHKYNTSVFMLHSTLPITYDMKTNGIIKPLLTLIKHFPASRPIR